MIRTWCWAIPAFLGAAAVVLPLFSPGPVARFPVAIAPPVLLLVVAARAGLRWASTGAVLLIVAFVVFHVLWFQQGAPPFPSPAEIAFGAAYVAICVEFLRWGRGGDRILLLDSAVLVLGPGLVVISLLVRPVLAVVDPGLGLVIAGFPSLDLLLLTLTVRLCFQGRIRGARAVLVLSAWTVLLFGDTGLMLLLNTTVGRLQFWFGAPTSVALTLFAAALALTRGTPPPAGGGENRVRVALLPVAACVPPVALFLQGLSGAEVDWQVLGGGSVLMAVLITVRLRNALQVMAAQTRSLRSEARTDHLTGLLNRREFTTDLNRAAASGTYPKVSLILLDLDHFKSVNDRWGHDRGDRLLREASAAWLDVLSSESPGSRLYRWGGEEFLVLLTGATVAEAMSIAESVRLATPAPHTVSAGVAVLRPGEVPADLLARADRELYRAKQSGRDRVCV